MMTNFIPTFNQAIHFEGLTEDQLRSIAAASIADVEKQLQTITTLDVLTFEQTLGQYDQMLNRVSVSLNINFLISQTTENEILRNTAHEAVEQLEQFFNKLQLHEGLYRTIKKYSQTDEATQLTSWKHKFLTEIIRDFERNGFGLDSHKREILKNLQNELSRLSNLFQKNIAEHQDQLILDENQLNGLPEDYKQSRKNDDGTYTIGLDAPSYVTFMQHAENDEARKTLYIKYLNRAADKNLAVLTDVLKLRKQIVNLLGYPTYATWQHETLMSKKPETVWQFENELRQLLRPKALLDYEEIQKIKQAYEANNEPIKAWQSGFYKTKLMKQNYEVDNEKLKEYFVLDNVLKGIFDISGQLFNITFVEKIDAILWHTEARLFDVMENEKLIGRLYLDFFPRPNKYNHAACFPLVAGCQTAAGYQVPMLALVCNFPKPSAEKPSLLRHADVETLFHEFGHALHTLLTQSPLMAYAGTGTARDFVEVPSQLFENWAWNYEILTRFAFHYDSGEVLPKNLFDKMWAARNVGSGLFAEQQVFYALYDLTIHDSYNPDGDQTTTDLMAQLQNEITLYPHVENTHFQAAFGHLMGYAASYYGYMWAKVYAEDMFSIFEENGLLNADIGQKYRQTVLAKGGSEDEMTQIINFLERKPKKEPFLKSLGL